MIYYAFSSFCGSATNSFSFNLQRISKSSISFKTEYNENFEDAMNFEDSFEETKQQKDSKGGNSKDEEDKHDLYAEQVKVWNI